MSEKFKPNLFLKLRYWIYRIFSIDRHPFYKSPKWCTYPDTFNKINYCWSYGRFITEKDYKNAEEFKKNVCEKSESCDCLIKCEGKKIRNVVVTATVKDQPVGIYQPVYDADEEDEK